MGCCSSKGDDWSSQRIVRWRSTGIVAIRDSKLKALPSEVLEVGSSVRTLDLTNNKLVEILPDIGNFVNAQRLILPNNLIECLPANLGSLQSLKVLMLDGNRIKNLPDELGALSKLEQLSVAGNLLMCLPNTIGNLNNLVLLNVSNNKLKALPEAIGTCTSLEEVQANGRSLSLIMNLHYEKNIMFCIADNSIEDPPPSICNLFHLKSLSLNKNNVHLLPQNLLRDCKTLQNISLHENPIVMEQFLQMDGFQEFEARRRKKFDKQIDSNVMMGSSALDEGLDL